MPTISPISRVSATESPQVESSCLRELAGQCWGWSRFGVEWKCNERVVREESLERKKRTEWTHLATNRKEFSCFACKLSRLPTWRITAGSTASNERVYLIGSRISKHQSHQGLCCSQILQKACVCCTLGQQVPILKETGERSWYISTETSSRLLHFSQTQFPLMTGRHSNMDVSEKKNLLAQKPLF